MADFFLKPPCRVPLLDGEHWWGGRTADGIDMPYSAGRAQKKIELHTDLRSNQGAPFLVSSHGRYLWSDRPFAYEFRDGTIFLTGSIHQVLLSDGYQSQAGAFRAASQRHFPPAGKVPPAEFFNAPQYNTWIEFNHHQTQQGVLEYAGQLVKHGYPPGIFMIDSRWFEYFGHLDFHPGRFPDPRGMVRQLKEQGFRVMIWVSPYVSADSHEFRRWRDLPGRVLRNRDGSPAILKWWDGFSIHLDFTHPETVDWFHGELQRLQRDYGVDGFKFDAGDVAHYEHRPASWLDATPVDLCEAWARMGLRYPFNEFRACWKLAGTPLIQRLQDKSPYWDESGLASLIPNSLAAGLLGHPYICPDMIGGGDFSYFLRSDFKVDEELFIRSAQTAALFPMMQFSSAPWRVLSKRGNDLCKAAALLHQQFVPLFLAEAAAASVSGEPILRSLEYEFAHRGYAAINDQFLIGHTLMAAPVLQRGGRTRQVVIPPGIWRDDRGEIVTGPTEIEIETPLDRVPHWVREQVTDQKASALVK